MDGLLSRPPHHTADAAAVLREARRVLRPEGRIAYTVWAANDQLEAFGIAFAAVAELVPDLAASPQPPSIGDAPPDHERLLSDNGFVQPTARTLELTWALTDGEAILDGFWRYLDLADQPDEIRRALRDRLDAEVARRDVRADATDRSVRRCSNGGPRSRRAPHAHARASEYRVRHHAH